ncbi:MAG: cysteine hydrolase [Microthrixaceae bacterium]
MSQLELPVPVECAVVTMEMQRGVVGDLATMPALAKAAQSSGVVTQAARLVEGARAVGAPVVHATVSWRSDRQGTSLNNPLSRSLARNPGQILHGSEAVELLADFGDTSADLISHRHHGLTPFTGTNLDATLRALGVSTVIAVGVSVNVGVMALVLNAADLGYRVVVATDAVIGVPLDYTQAVFKNTFRMVATLATVDEVLEAWSSRS